jgi:hypothetical protein
VGVVATVEGGAAAEDEERTQDDEMIEATENAEIVGGRAAITRHIFDAAVKCIFEPIQLFHKTRLYNKEAKQIKGAITLPRLSKTAQRVAQVVASERPAERPVLRGLIQETADKTTFDLEKRILLLEDKLKSATLKQAKKTGAKNEKGDGTKSPPKSILRTKKGKPTAPNQTPKKKKAAATAQDANSNVTVRASKKKQAKKHHVSFDGNKGGQSTNSRK